MKKKKIIGAETYGFIALLFGGFYLLGSEMGVGNLFNTIMNTAHDLLLNTVFFIMAISVVTGAVSNMLSEFGCVSLINKIISPIMRPAYGLPGAASVGVIATFASDNPAILSLAKNEAFVKYFKKYQIPALCNLGTSFGMGMVLVTYMLGIGGEVVLVPALIGVFSAFLGSIVSVRMMLRRTRKYYNVSKEEAKEDYKTSKNENEEKYKEVTGSIVERGMNSLLEGGKTGVQLGLDIIPGVLCICTLVMILTFGPSEGGVYTGAAYEGIALLPKIGEIISPITSLLFGFNDPTNIAFPITSLGATGAAMALVPRMLETGAAGMNEIAVFTAMGMCWSGYLSTHISMMDALDNRHFIKDALFSHTIGGLCAGVFAHYIYLVVSMF